MANVTTRPSGVLAVATVLTACNKGSDSSRLLSKSGAVGALGSAVRAFAPDPCAYLAGSEASRQHGRELLTVKNDVMVGMVLQSADYHKSMALLTANCATL